MILRCTTLSVLVVLLQRLGLPRRQPRATRPAGARRPVFSGEQHQQGSLKSPRQRQNTRQEIAALTYDCAR
jgi:hypothetical protein